MRAFVTPQSAQVPSRQKRTPDGTLRDLVAPSTPAIERLRRPQQRSEVRRQRKTKNDNSTSVTVLSPVQEKMSASSCIPRARSNAITGDFTNRGSRAYIIDMALEKKREEDGSKHTAPVEQVGQRIPPIHLPKVAARGVMVITRRRRRRRGGGGGKERRKKISCTNERCLGKGMMC